MKKECQQTGLRLLKLLFLMKSRYDELWHAYGCNNTKNIMIIAEKIWIKCNNR